MDSQKTVVIWKTKAEKSLQGIYDFIANDSILYAEKFVNKLIDFGHNLNLFPDKYPICRQQKFLKRSYHCAVFENNYLFVYKVVRKQLIIYNIIHCKRLR
ncbi:MAG: hypothetical protein A2046_09175 [Bacteroidetes bacterium GWA2_30_7]|nr:MAG: hypothetical protein A2046_09175 [Bacteroidetes bacterium GWA2_30_7]